MTGYQPAQPRDMVAGRPLPRPDDQSAPFWEACDRSELVSQRCLACGRWRFPPRPTCPACRSFEVHWPALDGRGRIWSWIRAHPPLLPAFAELAPYLSVVVALDEDPVHLRMVGLLRDAGADPEIGAPVIVDFEQVGERRLPFWRGA